MSSNNATKGVFFVLLLSSSNLLMAAGGSIMKPDIGLSFWSLVSFGLVVIILHKTAWGPLQESLKRREDSIEGAIESAKKTKEEAENLLAEYKDKLASAEEEMKAIIQKGRDAVQKEKDTLIKNAQEECQKIRDRNEREIEQAKNKAIHEIFEVAAEASVEISTKLIRKSLDKKTQNEIVQETLGQFKEKYSLN